MNCFIFAVYVVSPENELVDENIFEPVNVLLELNFAIVLHDMSYTENNPVFDILARIVDELPHRKPDK